MPKITNKAEAKAVRVNQLETEVAQLRAQVDARQGALELAVDKVNSLSGILDDSFAENKRLSQRICEMQKQQAQLIDSLHIAQRNLAAHMSRRGSL